ncbi:pancreatic triacylglycerol lipase-like [Dermacentor albipictus]|uniref:pancreatic triacylglycerol lipase-like n=1 Tax=Dermacentor albipictus TaxID=60249 RepID=UPI0031FD0C24
MFRKCWFLTSKVQRCVTFAVTLLTLLDQARSLIFGDRPMSACYGELGCLNLTGFYDPKVRFVNAMPWPRSKIGTHFQLYTRRKPDVPDIFAWNVTAQQLRDSAFDPRIETKLLAHGFLQVERVPDYPMKAVRDALLQLGDFNVILVDWARGSRCEYVQATANTRVVGLEVARLISLLQEAFGVSPYKFHMFGHSLGSHIAGYAGQKLRRLGRITGLDPAGPFFEGMSPLVRLDPVDAVFVDAIHTDGARFMIPLPVVGYGMIDPVAHIDFYPNGGVTQPGCEKIVKNFSLKKGAVQGFRDSVTCRHERATQIVAEALVTEASRDLGQCAFVAYACASYELFLSGKCADCGPDGTGCAMMGLSSFRSRPRQGTVKMYIQTNQEAPFCLYHYYIVVHVGPLPSPVSGKLRLQLMGQEGQATLTLSKTHEYFSSGSRLTYLSTTRTRVGDILEGAVNLLSTGNGYKGELAIQRVDVSLMNNIAVARYKKRAVIPLFPTVNNGSQITLSRCNTY